MDNSQHTPPGLARHLLLWILKGELAEEVLGDLEEKFYQSAKKTTVWRAKLNYWFQVFNYLRPFAIKKNRSTSNYSIMVQHNFKLTYRNFLKYKGSFFINLIGLATGLACVFLIYLWVADELAMDKFHTRDSQLYQIMLNHEENGGLRTGPETQGLLAEAVAKEIPEVARAVEDTNPEWFSDNFTVSDGQNFIKARGKFSGKEYLTLFSYPLKHGDPTQALEDKKGIVITESLALKLFGTTEEIIGKPVEWHLLHLKNESYVSGVLKVLPANSTDRFEFILPFAVYKDIVAAGMHWGNYNALTYVELAKNTDVMWLNKKVAGFIKEKVDWSNVTPFFKQYSKNYLYGTYENGVQTGGRILYVKLFSLVALFVLVIACINFMNLSTARASRRLKEIGVKKTLGAGRAGLIGQYITEATLITFIAVITACFVTYLLLPQFNQLTGKQLTLQFTPRLLLTFLAITLFTGLLAGSYPALYLSGFKPIHILKGKLNTSFGELWTRKGLVVFQFVLSIILVVSVLVVYKQIDYVQNKNLGYDKDNILRLPVEGKVVQSLESFLTGLRNIPGVIDASATSHSFVESGSYTTGVEWPGKDPDQIIRFEQARVYYDLIETLGITLKAGRSFSSNYGAENSKIIFNETAIAAMGLSNPIGKTVNMWGEDKEIIGVVKDFNYASLHRQVEPMLFHLDPEFLQNAMIRLDSRDVKGAIEQIAAFYKNFNPGYSFEYEFLDQNYQKQYVAEERVSVLSRYFAGVAIIISCLGLFGLAAFTAERRQKEIGIRKILGAENFGIVALLSGEFTKMVVVAISIAVPISYFLSNLWLNEFAFRIDLQWWFFASAGLMALLITWLTIGFQTIKAARVNPVSCLKDE